MILFLGVSTTWGSVLKGHNIRKVDNQWIIVIALSDAIRFKIKRIQNKSTILLLLLLLLLLDNSILKSSWVGVKDIGDRDHSNNWISSVTSTYSAPRKQVTLDSYSIKPLLS